MLLYVAHGRPDRFPGRLVERGRGPMVLVLACGCQIDGPVGTGKDGLAGWLWCQPERQRRCRDDAGCNGRNRDAKCVVSHG